MAVKILIADDHEIVRQGIRRVLEVKPEWEICGEASNGQEAVRMAQELSPDIIIMDVTMPVMSGFEAADEISRSSPSALEYCSLPCTIPVVWLAPCANRELTATLSNLAPRKT